MLSSNLEKTLRNAYQFAAESKHEFVTLEHLLKSLTDDKDALSVLKACGVEIDNLKQNLEDFIKNELSNLTENFSGEPKLTNSFQRVLQRAAIHVQGSPTLAVMLEAGPRPIRPQLILTRRSLLLRKQDFHPITRLPQCWQKPKPKDFTSELVMDKGEGPRADPTHTLKQSSLDEIKLATTDMDEIKAAGGDR